MMLQAWSMSNWFIILARLIARARKMMIFEEYQGDTLAWIVSLTHAGGYLLPLLI